MGVLRFALRELKKFAFTEVTPEMEENYRTIHEGENMLREMKEEREASIQAAIEAQASGEQISGIDRMLAWMGGGKADEDPSSSSSSAVRASGKAAAPKNTATPGKPFANKVGDVVKEKGKPFTGPQGNIFKGGMDAMRVAQLIGG